jgi:hypothetical protein
MEAVAIVLASLITAAAGIYTTRRVTSLGSYQPPAASGLPPSNTTPASDDNGGAARFSLANDPWGKGGGSNVVVEGLGQSAIIQKKSTAFYIGLAGLIAWFIPLIGVRPWRSTASRLRCATRSCRTSTATLTRRFG